MTPRVILDRSELDALIFDVDGVLTDTAAMHRRAWKQILDRFLCARDGDGARRFSPEDYRRYVDGNSRYDGVREFLDSRAIALPPGSPDDPPGLDTVCAIGNLKNRRFLELLEEEGAEAYDDAVRLLEQARKAGFRVAAITAGRNGQAVLAGAGLGRHFDVTVDGEDVASLEIPGKPDPAIFLTAARRLGVEPSRAAIVDDAIAGVEAAHEGGFHRVVGVDRRSADGWRRALTDAGAHRVVTDLQSLLSADGAGTDVRRIRELPSALEAVPEIWGRIGPRPALLLDYDGTLAPIVDDPADARLAVETHEQLREVARRCTVAVVSGRDLDDLRDLVRIDGIFYAGSHGLHLREPDGTVHERGREWIPLLDRAQAALADLPEEVEGVTLERKRFGLAVHYRRIRDRARIPEVTDRVRTLAGELDSGEEGDPAPRGLRLQEGKEVVELCPDLDWDKGAAVGWILQVAGGDTVPVYVGDDVADEDAFRALPESGVGIVVRGANDERTSEAEYVLLGPREVRHFLLRIREMLEQDRNPAGKDAGAGA